MAMLDWKTLVVIAILNLLLLTYRLIIVLPAYRSKPTPRKRNGPAHLLIVLGSGGHTAEMLSMLHKATTTPQPPSDESVTAPKTLDWQAFTYRTWLTSSGDAFSATRAKEFEDAMNQPGPNTTGSETTSNYAIASVPRARKIHQPLLTTPLSSLQCLWACLSLLVSSPVGYPDLILTNGPATATILVFASVLLRFFDLRGAESQGKMRTVYVESWARVKKLSLSGRLLCLVADRVLVQWEQLEGVQGRGEYLGVLVG